MHRIVYLSLATAPLAPEQLAFLLAQARQHNAELDVTGMLLYGNERFLQVLEGEKQAVQGLYESIKRDPRHQNIITYVDAPATQRAFAEWGMAFQTGNVQQLAEAAGYLGPPSVRISTLGLSPYERHILTLLRSFTQP
jgi:hypothetical protein